MSSQPRAARRRLSFASLVGRLSLLNVGVAMVGVVTGPLQARALGPAGRGELAAILTPFVFLPTLASVGLGSYAARSVARGRDPGEQLGSLLPVALGLGLLVAGLSPVMAGFLAGGRAVVFSMLTVGFVIFPLGMVANMLLDVAIGLEMWGPVMTVRVIPPALQLLGIPVLYVAGRLTVTSAAVVTFAGGVLALLPTLGIYRMARPLRFNFDQLRCGVSFGAKCWVGGLSNIASARLDQLLMIRMVSSTVLGLYAVAVTLATFITSPLVAAISTIAGPRLARDEESLAARLCRITALGALVVALGVGAITPLVLRYVFGPRFVPAVSMTLVLLLGAIPNAAGNILSGSISAAGQPGRSARGEGLALVVTVVGLAAALPTLGALGAAIVSAVAYTVQFSYLLRAATEVCGGRYIDYVRPTGDDVRLLWSLCIGRFASMRASVARIGMLSRPNASA